MRNKQTIIHEKSGLVGVWTFTIRRADGSIRSIEKRNLTPDIFLQALAEQTAGLNSEHIGQNLYVGLGTGNTAPSASDTTLETETVRKLSGSEFRVNQTAKIAAFFNASELSGTYQEVGLFMNGMDVVASGSADTGIMASRVTEVLAISAGETLTCSFNLLYQRA